MCKKKFKSWVLKKEEKDLGMITADRGRCKVLRGKFKVNMKGGWLEDYYAMSKKEKGVGLYAKFIATRRVLNVWVGGGDVLRREKGGVAGNGEGRGIREVRR